MTDKPSKTMMDAAEHLRNGGRREDESWESCYERISGKLQAAIDERISTIVLGNGGVHGGGGKGQKAVTKPIKRRSR